MSIRLIEACRICDISKVIEYLNTGDDPSDINNLAIRWASENGHFEVVKLLLEDERVDPSDCNNYAIQITSENGHFEVVKLLYHDYRFKMTDNLYKDKCVMNMIYQIRQDKLNDLCQIY